MVLGPVGSWISRPSNGLLRMLGRIEIGIQIALTAWEVIQINNWNREIKAIRGIRAIRVIVATIFVFIIVVIIVVAIIVAVGIGITTSLISSV